MKKIKFWIKLLPRFFTWLKELPYKKRTLYWVGGDGRLDDRSHWSTERNGKGGAKCPRMKDDIIFTCEGQFEVWRETCLYDGEYGNLYRKITTN